VHHEEVEGAVGEEPLGLPRARGGDHLVPRLAQGAAEGLEDAFLVVREQDGAARFHNQVRAAGGPARGSSIRISIPSPGPLRAETAPPRASTMFFAIARPRPVPVRLVVK